MGGSRIRARLAAILLAGPFLGWTGVAEGSIQLLIEQVKSGPDPVTGVSFEAEGNEIVVSHRGFWTTCCYLADASLDLRGNRILLRERNAGEVCKCPGTFDIDYKIRRIFPATYEVALYGEDGALLGEKSLSPGPLIQQKDIADCGDPSPGDPAVTISVEGDTIFIHQVNALENACLQLAAAVEFTDGTIRVRQKDLGPPCDCVSYYDLLTEIPGIPPGRYDVEFYDLRGTLAASGAASIDPPRLIATQARIPLGIGEKAEIDRIRPEGMDVVAERWFAEAQCCLDYRAEATAAKDQIVIQEVDRGPPCDCIGVRDLRIEALDFPPGKYQVALQTLEGVVLQEVVTIGEPLFVRGMVTPWDPSVDISDAVAILFHLYASVEAPCEDAADVNDSGALDITDAIVLLEHLFRSGPAPEPPYPLPGPDPRPDPLGCASPPCLSEKFAFEKPEPVPWDLVEFCIPAVEECKKEVLSIYPEAKVLSGVPGQIYCTEEEYLVTIDWNILDRSKLCGLSLLDYVLEIRGSHLARK